MEKKTVKKMVRPSEYIRERIEKGELDPTKLSKYALWILDNPGGIGTWVGPKRVTK